MAFRLTISTPCVVGFLAGVAVFETGWAVSGNPHIEVAFNELLQMAVAIFHLCPFGTV